MEGSRSSYSSKSHSLGPPPSSPPRSSPPPPSSISELFDGWAPKSNGGLFGFGTEFNQQGSGVMGRESNKTERTATQKGHFEGNSGGNSARNMNSSNSQKYQSSKSQNLSDAFLGSSLYYGGRDLYHDPSTVKTEGIDKLNKDNMDDDTNTSKASRGNWWQGSLYY